MTYSESAQGVVISKARALQKLARHGVGDTESVALFLAECGDRDTYLASDVLAWLGY
jgi:hypothetical protein